MLVGQVIIICCKSEIRKAALALIQTRISSTGDRAGLALLWIFFSSHFLKDRKMLWFLFFFWSWRILSALSCDDLNKRYKCPTAHTIKSLLAWGNKPFHRSATCVPVGVGKGAGCNKKVMKAQDFWALQKEYEANKGYKTPLHRGSLFNKASFDIIFCFSMNLCRSPLLLFISFSVPTHIHPKWLLPACKNRACN